jgi:hypothetical protein
MTTMTGGYLHRSYLAPSKKLFTLSMITMTYRMCGEKNDHYDR